MRLSEIISILAENEIESQIIDFLTIMDAEQIDSIPLETLVKGLQGQGIDVHSDVLFDILDNLAIVKNIKDNIVYFNSTSDDSMAGQEHNPEKDKKTVSKLANKKIDKELNK